MIVLCWKAHAYSADMPALKFWMWQLESVESVLEPRITFLDRFGINLRFKYAIQTPAGQPQVMFLALNPIGHVTDQCLHIHTCDFSLQKQAFCGSGQGEGDGADECTVSVSNT
jgi:hypothetical protein